MSLKKKASQAYLERGEYNEHIRKIRQPFKRDEG